MVAVAPTLAGKRVTHATVTIPAWGTWYADVSIDGEETLSGQVDLALADVTFKGTVLSGGPAVGRSHYFVVGGFGGWGKTLTCKSYANDAGVKLSTVLGDVASEVGESIDPATVPTTRLGPSFVRPKEPAGRVLEQLSSKSWYVASDGITRLGARASTVLPSGFTRTSPVDRAGGCVELAGELIASLVPGVVVDGLEAVDVVHRVDAKSGLRTMIHGRLGGETSRRLDALRALSAQVDPHRNFRSVWEYRVVTLEGNRCNIQPVLVSTGMPDLQRVPIRPGVAGARVAPALGSRVLAAFVNADPSRPFICGFEEIDGAGFSPQTVDLLAGAQVGGEHIATVEGTALLIYNTLVALMAAAGGGPLTALVLQPLLATAISAALTAQVVPAPPGTVAQTALHTSLQAGFATGLVPVNTMFAAWLTAIAAVGTKTPDVSGKFPSAGAARVRTG